MPAKKKATQSILKVGKPKAKAKTKVTRKRKQPTPKTGRRLLDTIGNVFMVHDGENVTIHITVKPDVQEVTLTLNGRGVFRGLP